jgi:hypothetical protein
MRTEAKDKRFHIFHSRRSRILLMHRSVRDMDRTCKLTASELSLSLSLSLDFVQFGLCARGVGRTYGQAVSCWRHKLTPMCPLLVLIVLWIMSSAVQTRQTRRLQHPACGPGEGHSCDVSTEISSGDHHYITILVFSHTTFQCFNRDLLYAHHSSDSWLGHTYFSKWATSVRSQNVALWKLMDSNIKIVRGHAIA